MMLPNGWKRVKLGDVAKVTSGGTPSKDNSSYWNGDIPWISALEMHNIFVDSAKLKITKEALKKGSSLAKKDDLLLLTRGSMLWNRIPVCLCLRDVAFNQDVKCIHPKDSIDSKFLLYWFGSMENLIMNKVEGTGIGAGKLATDYILDLNIMVPPLSEQKKIAETLSVWDRAIEKTEKLIEAKILSMQSALIDFFNDHLDNVVNLGDLFGGEIIIEKGRILLKKQTNGGGIPIVAAGQSYSGYHNEYTHNIPTITVSSSGAYAGFVWYHSEPIWASDCSVLHTKKINLKYLFYFLKKEQEKIFKMQSGGAQPHIYAKDLKQLLFPIIDNRDQNNMVSLFDLLDEEISILKQQLENYKKQKQGLMQKLLTGQWRVK